MKVWRVSEHRQKHIHLTHNTCFQIKVDRFSLQCFIKHTERETLQWDLQLRDEIKPKCLCWGQIWASLRYRRRTISPLNPDLTQTHIRPIKASDLTRWKLIGWNRRTWCVPNNKVKERCVCVCVDGLYCFGSKSHFCTIIIHYS